MTGILLDAVATAPGSATTVTSLSWTHVTGSGTSQVLLVWAGYNGPASGPGVTSVTYGGVAATKLLTEDPSPGNGIDKALDLWYLVAPSAGSASVVVTFAALSSAMGSSVSYSGVSQSSPFRTPQGFASTSSNAPSVSTTGGSPGDVVLAGLHARVATTVTPGGAQASLAGFLQGGSTNNYMALTSQPGGTGTVTSSWSWTAADMASLIAVALVPAFPAVPLDLRTEINAGGWQNVSTGGNVYQRTGTPPPVTIARGRPDETSSANASSATFQVNNRLGSWSLKNPLGTWYGKLGRNTPVRFSLPAIGNYLRLEDAVSAAICPDAAALDIAGDIDIRVDMTLTGIGPSGVTVAAHGYNGLYTGGTQGTLTSWVLALEPDMTPLFTWSANGTLVAGQVQGQLPVPSRGRFALRATLSVATGTVTFYTASSMGGSWTQLGPAASGTLGAATSLYASLGEPLTVGMATWQPLGALAFAPYGAGICGRVWEFQLRNGIGGTVVADPVFSSQTGGVTSFADAQANAWALYGTAEISSRDYRYHGELSQLPPKWDVTGTDQWVAATAGGLLRRLGQGSASLLSPMARYYTVPGAPVCAAYWPMEDAAGATHLGALIGQQPMFFSGSPQLANSSAFTGSSPLPVTAGASFTGAVAYTGTWTDNDVHWLMQMPSSTPEPDGTVVAVIATTGSPAQLTVTYNTASSGSLTLRGYDPTGALLFTTTSLTGVNGKAYAVQVYLQNAGANVSLTVSVPGSGSGSGVGTTFAGTVGQVRRVSLNPNGGLTGTAFGHLAVLPSFVSVLALNQYQTPSGAWTGPVTAWQYEPAGVRAGRLVIEQGMQFRGIGDLLHTPAMGPQTATGLVSLLQECEAADRGMLTEPRSVLGIGYRARSSMYNQTPLVLDYSQAELGGTGTLLEPTFDDQFVRNDETVSRSGGTSSGASARYVLADGSSMSTGVIGVYANSDSLNLAFDGQLQNLAAWIVHVGTVNEARWPVIPLNLARSELAALWWQLLDQDVGDRFQIPNLPNVVMYDPADQLVSQVKEPLGGFFFQQEWNAIPASPYTVAAAGTAHAATAGSLLAAGVNSTATSLSVSVTAGNLWTTSAGDFPFDIAIAGERMTVANITGASSPQAFTVTRSVNGVVKAQLANAPVQVWTLPVGAL